MKNLFKKRNKEVLKSGHINLFIYDNTGKVVETKIVKRPY